MVDHANRLRHLLFPRLSERLFLKALPRSETLPLKHLELMADAIGYGEYFRYLLGRMAKRLGSSLLFRAAPAVDNNGSETRSSRHEP